MSPTDLVHRLPRHLKLSELRVFVAVLEHRSFRRAATVLHLTQPAITKAIAGLEEMLEVKLFHRFTHGVEPTVHGLSFEPRALAIFDELRRAAQDLSLASRGTEGTLRVGITPMPAIPFLPVAINHMLELERNIFVSLVEAREAELMDRLRTRDIEIAFLRLALIEPGDDTHVTKLFDEKLSVIAGKDHRLAGRKKLQWAELLAERWVMPPVDCSFYQHLQTTLVRAGLEIPEHAVEAISVPLQFNMVLHAGMLGFGMRSQIEFAPGKAFLVRLPFDIPTPETAVRAVTLKSRVPSPLAQELIGHIRRLGNTA
jgi:DNA-binding transcriptional LysR family regulator